MIFLRTWKNWFLTLALVTSVSIGCLALKIFWTSCWGLRRGGRRDNDFSPGQGKTTRTRCYRMPCAAKTLVKNNQMWILPDKLYGKTFPQLLLLFSWTFCKTVTVRLQKCFVDEDKDFVSVWGRADNGYDCPFKETSLWKVNLQRWS